MPGKTRIDQFDGGWLSGAFAIGRWLSLRRGSFPRRQGELAAIESLEAGVLAIPQFAQD
jgi:hypothetical protein